MLSHSILLIASMARVVAATPCSFKYKILYLMSEVAAAAAAKAGLVRVVNVDFVA